MPKREEVYKVYKVRKVYKVLGLLRDLCPWQLELPIDFVRRTPRHFINLINFTNLMNSFSPFHSLFKL